MRASWSKLSQARRADELLSALLPDVQDAGEFAADRCRHSRAHRRGGRRQWAYGDVRVYWSSRDCPRWWRRPSRDVGAEHLNAEGLQPIQHLREPACATT